MNKRQLSDHIGNIDDRLVEKAAKVPNYKQEHRRKGIRRLIAAAATFVLMTCSFTAGAFAFSHETVVEVPVEQETVTLEEIDLTLILPDSWKDQYSIEKDGQNYIFYHTQTRESIGEEGEPFGGGVLFYIVCYEGAMTPDQFVENGLDFVPYSYLFSTKDNTYVLCHASDVQWNLDDPEQADAYQQMAAQVENIQFVVDNALAGQ